MAVATIFQNGRRKMADSGYCYDAYLLYCRGMQVDSERLFIKKGPVMVKESDFFSQNGLIQGQYPVIKVTYNDQKRSKK